MVLHGCLHLIRKALVRSLVGRDLPRVLRLSLRFCESVFAVATGRVGMAGMLAVAVIGRAGWAVVSASAAGELLVDVLGEPVGIGR